MASRPLARAAIILGSLGFAALALASGIDRLSESRPALARAPLPLAAQAWRIAGRAQIDTGDAQAALQSGTRAVGSAPVDPESTALLGAARLGSGDRAGAERAFRVAGELGWRVPYTQLYWMGRALELGDYRVAALRLDALLRQRPALIGNARLMAPLETSEAGRAALAERMLAGPAWLSSYTGRTTGTPRDVLERRAGVLLALRSRGAMVGCTSVAPLVEKLVDSGAVGTASQLWHAHCPGAGRALIYDGQFAEAVPDQSRSQFAWTFVGQSDVEAVLERQPGSRAQVLAIDSQAARERLVVRQLVLAPPGRYRVSWRADTPDGGVSDLVIISLACTPDPRDWQPGRLDPSSHRWVAEVTIDGSCPARWLSFGVAGRSGSARLGAIAFEPLP